MAAWTEEATFPQPAADPAALRPAAPEAFAITGAPWVTIGLLLATACVLFTAPVPTLASAIGADSCSLGASGMAFGVLGASVTFGWRRGVRGTLRSYFGLRIVPWLLALFAAGLGSAGVDNWGHGGGLFTG